MRLLASLLALGLLAVATPAALRAQDPGAAAEVRHGFEDGTGGFTFAPAPGGTGGRMELSAEDAAEGKAALTLVPANVPEAPSTAAVTLSAERFRGQIVEVAGWAYASGAPDAFAGVILAAEDANGREVSRTIAFGEQTPAWVRVRAVVIIPVDAVTLRFGGLAINGTARFDDLALTLLAPDHAPLAPEAEAYLNEALDVLAASHINRDRADWARLRDQALRLAAGATTPADTHEAIEAVVTGLGEPHGFFERPSAPAVGAPALVGPAPSQPRPEGRRTPGGAGLLVVPELITVGRGDEVGPAYATALRGAVDDLAATGVCGWIIDLRGNAGGNMWPMLDGLEALLDVGPFGQFGTAEAAHADWRRTPTGIRGQEIGGQAWSEARSGRLAHQPLAILLGGQTASSGEMVAVALRGRPLSRTFGATTAGYTTANRAHTMPDGAHLVITVSGTRDRHGVLIRGALIPDEPLPEDEAAEAADRWLADHGCPSP